MSILDAVVIARVDGGYQDILCGGLRARRRRISAYCIRWSSHPQTEDFSIYCAVVSEDGTKPFDLTSDGGGSGANRRLRVGHQRQCFNQVHSDQQFQVNSGQTIISHKV